MRISEVRGEKAVDMLADLLDPITEIASDATVKEAVVNGSRIDAVRTILKSHKKQVLKILAILDEENPDTYSPSLPEIPMKILEFFNDPVFAPFFSSQGQKQEEVHSGSATENIGDKEE